MDEQPLRVLVVVGTRPEAIKLLPVIQELRACERLEPVVVATGQHSEMVASVLGRAGIVPDIDLGVGHPGSTLNQLFAGVVKRLERQINARFGPPHEPGTITHGALGGYPAACLVHGDTTSAAAAAICCFHLRIAVAHIEAGLRTRDTNSPFPEELNRQLIARIATFHLAPTDTNSENLVLEGVPGEQIFVTGNTGIDALRWAARQSGVIGIPKVDRLPPTTRVVVVTAHRRENWGSGLTGIGTGVARLATAYPDVFFVLPVHPNPEVGAVLRPLLSDLPNVVLTPPLGYLPFAKLLARAYLAISDSGGIQEEAPALGTPVLVTRTTTERGEGVAAGTLRLVGTDPDAIVRNARELLDDPVAYQDMVDAPNPYGDGLAAKRMVQAFEYIAFGTPPPTRFGAGFRRTVVLNAAGYDVNLLDATRPAPGRGLVPDVETELLDLAEASA